MIDGEHEHGAWRRGGRTWRRAIEVFDDYDGGGVLSEQLADDLVNELVGLGPRTRPGRPRRIPVRPGPQPSRPAVTPVPMTPTPTPTPRLTLVRGEA